jgi:hypothetical protein
VKAEGRPQEDDAGDYAGAGPLRAELEKLVLLEEVAERRQRLIEERLDAAVEAGMSPDDIRAQLRLSKETLATILGRDAPPELAARLGIDREDAEPLRDSAG